MQQGKHLIIRTQAFSEPTQTSKTELLDKAVNIFAKILSYTRFALTSLETWMKSYKTTNFYETQQFKIACYLQKFFLLFDFLICKKTPKKPQCFAGMFYKSYMGTFHLFIFLVFLFKFWQEEIFVILESWAKLSKFIHNLFYCKHIVHYDWR